MSIPAAERLLIWREPLRDWLQLRPSPRSMLVVSVSSDSVMIWHSSLLFLSQPWLTQLCLVLTDSRLKQAVWSIMGTWHSEYELIMLRVPEDPSRPTMDSDGLLLK